MEPKQKGSGAKASGQEDVLTEIGADGDGRGRRRKKKKKKTQSRVKSVAEASDEEEEAEVREALPGSLIIWLSTVYVDLLRFFSLFV